MDQHDLAAKQFGSTAQRYLTSTVHAAGQDLERLTQLASQSRAAQVLDLGWGAGHASFAVARAGAARVIAYDLDSLPSEATQYFALTPDLSFAIDSCWLESRKD